MGMLEIKTKLDCSGGGEITKQSFKDECDVNNVIAKYVKTGHLSQRVDPGFYGDFSQVEDYQKSLAIVKEAEEQFSSLSSVIRKRFNNDPEQMLQFCTDEKNLEEMYELGLAVRPKGELNGDGSINVDGSNTGVVS